MQKPRIGVVLDADLDVHEQPSSKEGGPMPESFLRDTQSSPESCQTKALQVIQLAALHV